MTTDFPDPRGQCQIDSGYPNDHACILAPSPEEGMQIHIGPSNYKDPEDVAKYVLKPGEETSKCWTFHTPNEEAVMYQTFVVSGREGTHHIINTMFDAELTDGGFSDCADPGSGTNPTFIDNLPGASKPYMPRTKPAPENVGIGREIPARAASQADMHYFNFTEKDLIREFWMNIYYVKKETVTERAEQIRAMGGVGLRWAVIPLAPGTDEVFKYECPISGNGRILGLIGHYHAHGKHFTASIRRGGRNGTPEKVFEMFDYNDPAIFSYDSVTQNPAFSPAQAGATSGILEVKDGDVLMWDCHIVNDSDVPLTYSNEVRTGEMCNLWGASLGVDKIDCFGRESN